VVLQPFYAVSYRYAVQATRWGDLADVWEFENQFFGDDNVSLETLRSWWWRYSRMALLVRDESGQVVGTFDASPLTAQAFAAVLDGTAAEADLSADDIQAPCNGEVVSRWCITSLTTHPALHRRVDALGALLVGIADRLANLPEVGGPSEWCAVGQSREGGRLLQHVGFRVHRSAAQTRDGKPIFRLTTDTADQVHAFRTTIARLAATYARRQAVLRSRLPGAA
jgi:hypothetical protein